MKTERNLWKDIFGLGNLSHGFFRFDPPARQAKSRIPPGVFVSSWEEEKEWLKKDWEQMAQDPFNSPAEE